MLSIFPSLTPDGYRVLYNSVPADPVDYDMEETVQKVAMVLDLLYFEDSFRRGLILLINYSPFQMGHITKIGISQLRRTTSVFLVSNMS